MARSILQFAEANVKYYGAKGDGVTDDTVAISAAISAIPPTGGALIFPPGTYVTSGGFVLANPTLIIGRGKAGFDGVTGGVSIVTCTSQTNSLFTVTGYHAKFQDIGLVNTFSGAPTDGAGITVAGSVLVQRVDFESVSVSKFYSGIDIQVGCAWGMHNCWIHAPVLYGVRVDNTVNPDAGDWAISNCGFFAAIHNAGAAIRIQNSGGGKISNCKINMALDGRKFNHGIDLTGGGTTSILLITNNSIENVIANAIHIDTGGWDYVVINGNQVHIYNNTGYAIMLDAGGAGALDGVVIANNILFGSAVAHEAIGLINVRYGRLTGNVFGGFTGLAAQTGTTDVVITPQ